MDASKSHAVYSFQGFDLNVPNRRLSDSSGQAVKLNSRAFDILVELVLHRGDILGKDYLMKTVWHDLVVEENNVNQAIYLIRKALGDSTGESIFIKTVSGKGFCFVADVHTRIVADESDGPPAPDEKDMPAYADSALHRGPPAAASMPSMLISGVAGLAVMLLLPFLSHDKVTTATESPASATLQAGSTQATGTEAPYVMSDSIAVMPFTNLGEDPTGDLFVLGLHDELINQLTRIKSLKVISRDSVISVSERVRSVFAAANFLKVESLITGSILVGNAQARVNLQMLDADIGVAVWSDSFEIDTLNFSEMISTQTRIALKVVKALEIEFESPETSGPSTLPTHSFEAYTYYLTARNAYQHQDNEGKWLLLSKALALDPEFADAHRLFASVNAALARSPMQNFTHEDHLRLTQESAEAYIRLEPARSDGYSLKSFALAATRNWKGAAEQVEILRQLGASDSEMQQVAVLLGSVGDFRGAISIFEASLAADPSNLYSRALLMALHEMAGNREQARRELALGNELAPAWWGDTVNVLLALGRREPLDSLDDLTDISPELLAVLVNVHDSEMTDQAVKRYMTAGVETALEDLMYAALTAYHDDIELASALLRMATEKVSTYIFWAWLPVFDEVRHTGQFRDLLVDSGLVDYWREHGWPDVCQPHKAAFSCNWVAYPPQVGSR